MITQQMLEEQQDRVAYFEELAESNYGDTYFMRQATFAAEALAKMQCAYDRQHDLPCEHGVPYSLCQAGCGSLA